jgi:hypothetical protein
MKTLHEMAEKLQKFMVDYQENTHSATIMNFKRYNNLKIRMDSQFNYPHITVSIGISEATFDIKSCIKTEGGLGPDEKYVRKWLESSSVVYDLNEIWKTMDKLLNENVDKTSTSVEGEADEVKIDPSMFSQREFKLKKAKLKDLLKSSYIKKEENK